ncbi:hypothetical protein DIPPA_12398 [Diplonema papillatum]|nr:hypothetical protein DIPPA_12398 [Diplonema papillatum]
MDKRASDSSLGSSSGIAAEDRTQPARSGGINLLAMRGLGGGGSSEPASRPAAASQPPVHDPRLPPRSPAGAARRQNSFGAPPAEATPVEFGFFDRKPPSFKPGVAVSVTELETVGESLTDAGHGPPGRRRHLAHRGGADPHWMLTDYERESDIVESRRKWHAGSKPCVFLEMAKKNFLEKIGFFEF